MGRVTEKRPDYGFWLSLSRTILSSDLGLLFRENLVSYYRAMRLKSLTVSLKVVWAE
jgi:hypothetical protein